MTISNQAMQKMITMQKVTVRMAMSAGTVVAATMYTPGSIMKFPEIARARATARPAPKTIDVGETIATGWDDRTSMNPASIPRSVPEAWVAEFNSIRRLERPGSLEGYYDQD